MFDFMTFQLKNWLRQEIIKIQCLNFSYGGDMKRKDRRVLKRVARIYSCDTAFNEEYDYREK